MVRYLLWIGGRQVDFIHDRNDFQVVLNGQIQIGNGLCLNALRRIHDQQGAFTGRNAARHFVAEVDVSWSVNQVQTVFFAVEGIVHLDRVALDGDTALSFQIHIVQELLLLLANGHRLGGVQ